MKEIVIAKPKTHKILIKDQDGVVLPLNGSNYTDINGDTVAGLNVDITSSVVSILFVDQRITPKPYKTYTPAFLTNGSDGYITFAQLVGDFDSPKRTGDAFIYADLDITASTDIYSTRYSTIRVMDQP